MRKHYITSLKGIACLFVAFGHFLGTLKYASSISLNTEWFSFLKTYRLDFLINESFWLYLFFVVSGYLVAHSAVTKWTELIIRGTLRFLRLAVPILFACLVIFLFSKAVPFYNGDTATYFENNWLQSAYSQSFTFLNMLLSPIYVLLFKKTIYNSPYWVLRSMMLASFLIYFITYVSAKIRSKVWRFAFVLSLTVIAFFFDKIVFSCLIGAVICYYEDYIHVAIKSKSFLSLLGLGSFALCFVSNLYGGLLFFSWLLIAIPRFTKIQSALEIKPLRFLGEISFGIYSFHWPIFCSVGALLIVRLWDLVGGGLAVLISIIASALITVIFSVAFYYTFEKISGKIVSLAKNKLVLLFAKNKKEVE